MLPTSLNYDQIMSQGHDGIVLPRSHYHDLLTLVQGLAWTSDPSGIFSRVPTILSGQGMVIHVDQFEKERQINQSSLERCPEDLRKAIDRLLTEPNVMGNWLAAHTPAVRFISIWDGAEDLDWHWDGPAGADFFFLIYLNKSPGWKESDGGQLLAGRRSVSGNYLKVNSEDVQHLGTYAPASRSLICCNNQNPQFVHKVLPLSAPTERTVLMIGFDMTRHPVCTHRS